LNFTRVDEGLFDELSAITATGREIYAAQGWLSTPPGGDSPKDCRRPHAHDPSP